MKNTNYDEDEDTREKEIEELADASGLDESDAEMLHDEGITADDI